MRTRKRIPVWRKDQKLERLADYPVWLICEKCGHEQTDIGRNVACEKCGARMPDTQGVRETP
jgi:Zn finger protein HypA/HybF involved in hydrogenase expression